MGHHRQGRAPIVPNSGFEGGAEGSFGKDAWCSRVDTVWRLLLQPEEKGISSDSQQEDAGVQTDQPFKLVAAGNAWEQI